MRVREDKQVGKGFDKINRRKYYEIEAIKLSLETKRKTEEY